MCVVVTALSGGRYLPAGDRAWTQVVSRGRSRHVAARAPVELTQGFFDLEGPRRDACLRPQACRPGWLSRHPCRGRARRRVARGRHCPREPPRFSCPIRSQTLRFVLFGRLDWEPSGSRSSRDHRQGQWDVTRRLVASRQQYTTVRRRIFSPSRSLPMTYAWLIPRHGRIGRQRSKISWISTCGSCAKRRSSRVRCGSGRRRHA